MAKYRMFIDESGNSDLGAAAGENNRFLCLTGIIFDLSYYEETFVKQFEKFKIKHFKKNVVLHRKDIIQCVDCFSVLKNENAKEKYNEDLLKNLKKWHYVMISVVLDKKEIVENYGIMARHPYYFCLEVLIEKYCIFLKNARAVGDLLIESRNKRDDRKLSEVYTEMFENGTRYLDSDSIKNYLTSKSIKIKLKSANIPGLQIADLLVTEMRNLILIKTNLKENKKTEFKTKLLNSVKLKIFKHNQKCWGYGLKKLP